MGTGAVSWPGQGQHALPLVQPGAAITEAGVNASNHSDHQVRHYAQTLAGAAFANPSLNQSALVTIVVLDATGTVLNTSTVTLPPEGTRRTTSTPGSIRISADPCRSSPRCRLSACR
jgi:hypothetical protein